MTCRRAFPFLLLLAATVHADQPPVALQTVAEKSGFKATSRHQEVVEFCQELAKASPVVRLGELGTSHEGRKLPLVILADPPVITPEEAAKSGKLVVFALANIHAGEVDGKEGVLMLARDLATAKDKPLLKDLIVVLAPIFNADGNDRIARTNRGHQVGPEEGVGERANAQGLDLNRDFVKLESPEVRSLVRFLNRWDPAIVLDLHTTNGSRHRYTITYDGPRNPAGDARLNSFAREQALPELGRRFEQRSGYKAFFYGNFSPDRTRWETTLAQPRYSIHYVGLRHRLAILVESYAFAPYRDRVLASRDFVRTVLEYAAENKQTIAQLTKEARDAATRAGRNSKGGDLVAVRHKLAPLPGSVTVLGFEEEEKDGRRVPTTQPKDYTVQFLARPEPTVSVRRPWAYLVPARYPKVIEVLQRHGIELDELREDLDLDVELYRLEKVQRTEREFQKHRTVTVETSPHTGERRVLAGTVLVKTGQPLGTLAVCLLEPLSDDGLCHWNFFDDALAEGKEFPVLRLAGPVALHTGKPRPLPEDRLTGQRITRNRPVNLSGNPMSIHRWLEDGEHFLQSKGGRMHKVHARTGRATPYQAEPSKLVESLAALPTLGAAAAEGLGEDGPPVTFGGRRAARTQGIRRNEVLLNRDNDLYVGFHDGSKAVRLTRTPAAEELATLSPDGKFVAFVRENNLYVVDVATQTERALTTDGTALIANGKADWVYEEELFYRRGPRAYWWAPDSKSLAFYRFDDTPVHLFTVLDHMPTRLKVETTPYPKAGDPNPIVRLGIVTVAGGPVQWADLSGYSENAIVLPRCGWMPDGKSVFLYIQDRAQTWLDFCTVTPRGELTRLFRETTKAWVEDPGDPHYLKDGSFLLFSDRTGWRHVYHFAANGALKKAVTSGEWEVRSLVHVDEESGWVYVTGTAPEHFYGGQLYRARLDGSKLERLTQGGGDHRIQLNPTATLFIDSWSDHQTPPQARLYDSSGRLIRTLDTNPAYEREQYLLGKYELVRIPMPDGFVLEGSILYPPEFNPDRRYPVWFKTYGGPYSPQFILPSVQDSYGTGQVQDQALASLGFIVFRTDPRSSSGKGMASAWTCYRQLGVQETKDIEAAIQWLCQRPYVDPARIGMSGHSYGGFLTAYAMTHTKLFAAGIAGAPVTDWRLYDTIYTERFMNTPQENPKGYEITSVVRAARNLHGKLLLLHGIMDDNVHLQNSVQLMQALQAADKDFEVMFYPRARHGIFGSHYQRLVHDFMVRHLRPTPSGEPQPAKLSAPGKQ